LAACLVFSSRIRKEFIRFVLNDSAKAIDSDEVDVVIQETIKGGYIDLVLRQRGTFVIAVEVKVRSPENCNHHRSQLLRYQEWLNQQTEELDRFLFTLVRNEDTTFHRRMER
jgi:RecB family endonuclease NucS